MSNIIGARKAVYKEYRALMHGALPDSMKEGSITHRLSTSSANGASFTSVDPKGKPSETRYEVIGRYRWGKGSKAHDYTLLKVHILTGRTHQIRVHVQELAREAGLEHCGLVGDYKYLPQKQNQEDKKFCPRVFLHESVLEFVPHGQQQPVRIECALPQELNDVLDKLHKVHN